MCHENRQRTSRHKMNDEAQPIEGATLYITFKEIGPLALFNAYP